MNPSRAVGYEFRFLLVALTLMVVVYPIVGGSTDLSILGRVLLTGIFVTGGRVVFKSHHLRLCAILGEDLRSSAAWSSYWFHARLTQWNVMLDITSRPSRS